MGVVGAASLKAGSDRGGGVRDSVAPVRGCSDSSPWWADVVLLEVGGVQGRVVPMLASMDNGPR